MNTELSLEEWALQQKILATKQYEMAVNLIDELLEFIPDLSDELNGELLLDALGCAGLSLTVGEYASQTFVARLHG
jgi:predicted RNA methylase